MFRMDRIRCLPLLWLISLAGLLSQPALGQWSQITSVNNEVSTMAHVSGQPQTLSDGNGGTFVVWATQFSTTSNDIFLNFIDANGNVTNADVPVGTGSDPVIAGAGGGIFYVAWSDLSKRLRIQQFLGLTPQWPQAFPVTLTGAIQTQPSIVHDGVGGAIVAWTHASPGGSSTDIHAMRFHANGARNVTWQPWTTGFVVNAFPGDQRRPDLASDSAQSAFVVWEHTNPSTLDTDIYARYVNLGTPGVAPGWPTAQPVVGAFGHQYHPRAVSDGSFGMLVGWYDSRNGLRELFAQRVRADSSYSWTPNGVRVGAGLGAEPSFDIGHDGSQGAVLAWSSVYDIRFQRLVDAPSQPDGVLRSWGTNGLPLTSGTTFTNQQRNPNLASDGQGGAMVAWGTHSKTNSNVGDIYAQYVDGNGAFLWTSSSGPNALVSNAANRQDFPTVIQDETVVNGIRCMGRVFWRDLRPDDGVYGQRVLCNGAAGIADPGGGSGLGLEVSSIDVRRGLVRVPIRVTRVHELPELTGLGLTLSFDPAVLTVRDVLAGSVGEVVYEVDGEAGTLFVETAGGHAAEGQPLLELVFEPRITEGSSAVAIHSGGGNGVSVWPVAGVVTVGEPH